MNRDWNLVRAAMELAIAANEDEYRKGTDIPYLSHLLAVTAIVYEHGGDDEQVAAALLHGARFAQVSWRLRRRS